MQTAEDLIDLALAQRPTQFAAALNDVLSMRAAQAVEDLRPTIAATMFSDEDPEDSAEDDSEDDSENLEDEDSDDEDA